MDELVRALIDQAIRAEHDGCRWLASACWAQVQAIVYPGV